MTRFAIALAALALAGTAASAETHDIEAGIARLAEQGGRYDAAIGLIRAEAAKPDWTGVAAQQPLPAHVTAEIERLRQHGDRFEAAIRALEASAALPTWGWDDCGHETAEDSLAAF